jgi:hypothetical protein
MDPEDGLAAWVGELRGCLGRGELAGLGRIDLGDGAGPLDGEVLVRVLLAELDHYDDLPPERRRNSFTVARRLRLLDDLRRLRERIG